MDKVLLEFFLKKGVGPDFDKSIETWVDAAAKKANQLRLATHNGKYSHTGAKKEVGCIALHRETDMDGYLRTGNYDLTKINTINKMDCFGNAASLDVYSFLSLVLENGQTVFEHVERESPYLRDELGLSQTMFEEVCNGFLKIIPTGNEYRTSKYVKQVYFPVDDAYHLLSLLTPSCLVSEMKDRLDETWRYSQDGKKGRDARRKHEYHEGYVEFFNITEMSFGGAQSQNVGVLNNRHGGTSYLLPSFPPLLRKREIRLPRKDFFLNCLFRGDFEELYSSLYRIFSTDYNNVTIRENRERLFEAILDKIVKTSWDIRKVEGGWSFRDFYSGLSLHQKIWLDAERAEERQETEMWLPKVIGDITRWICTFTPRKASNGYNPLGDDEFRYVRNLTESIQEALW